MASTVSVVLTTYNRPTSLAACLYAMQAQVTTRPFEICVVNDGGTSVKETIKNFPHLNIQLREFEANQGQMAARTAALRMATGTYVAFCDDDDRWLPLHLESLCTALEAQPNTSLAYTDAELVEIQEYSGEVYPQRRRIFAWRDAASLLRMYNPIVPSSVLLPRLLLQELGGLDEEMEHYWDWDLFLRVETAGAIVRVPACHTLYAVPVDGTSQSANPERMRDALAKLIAKHHLGRLPSSNFWRMLEEPHLQGHLAQSEQIWSGSEKIWRGIPVG